MMIQVPCVKLAFDLMHFPSQVRSIREASLPNDLDFLLRIAAGDDETIRQAMKSSGRSRETVRDAAGFFIEQILLFPEADSYRVLGATPEATNGELRRNMALLLRWLHPDLDRHGERSVFTTRVTRAWNDLKTPERRAAYDQVLRRSLVDKSLLRKKRASRRHKRASSRDSYKGLVRMGNHCRQFYFYGGEPPSLFRRLLFSLFGRAVP